MEAASSNPETREMMRAAAQWLALLDCEDASDADRTALQAWRESHPGHERAWQRALQLRQRFASLPPELARAVLDRPDTGRRSALKQILGVATLLPAAWLIGRQMPVEEWRADLQTATGSQENLTLAEGGSLLLNTDSAVDLDMAARQLRLIRGEIALKVSGPASLTILTPFGRATIKQGEACLRLYAQHCRVSAVSGTVQLSSSGGEQMINQGEQLNLERAGFSSIQYFDSSLPDWRMGVLMADDQPLGDFLRELSRYRPGLLRWDPVLEQRRVTGSFRLDDTDRVLELLAASLALQVQARTRYWVTLVPLQKNA